MLRQAAELHRLRSQKHTLQNEERVINLQDELASVRLALPAQFLQPTRDVVGGESVIDYPARFQCLMHLQASQILASLPPYFGNDEYLENIRWSQVIEACEKIVELVQNFDPQQTSRVDPAACYIA